MKIWSKRKAKIWYSEQPWLVGCNFIPSSAINQLEMFQPETYDPITIEREISWANRLGFNSLRVYLHDLLWLKDPKGFCERLDHFLRICDKHQVRPIFVLFDDCHRPNPVLGKQPLPVKGVHNSGWKQSPGSKLVSKINDNSVIEREVKRLKNFVQGIMKAFFEDSRILMWDIYNEPGQFGMGDKSFKLLKLTWEWAQEIRPTQPLTSCLSGSVGEKIIALNLKNSDVISFHMYEGKKIESLIKSYKSYERPILCTEYMARELGSTFQYSLPIFKKYKVGCYNWGLVAGKTQTHFNWDSILSLKKLQKQGNLIQIKDPIPEPTLWFHDILRIDGSAFNNKEVEFIKEFLKN